jgi:tetratricopeptide (TPR) repeat protein
VPIWIEITCRFAVKYATLPTASKVSARSQNTSKSITATITPPTVQKNTQQPDEKVIVTQAEKGLDRSIGVLNIVATSMGVLVGLIAIVFALAAALGFFEYRRWKSLRKEAEKHVKEIKDSAATIKPIVDKIQKAEEEVNQSKDKFKSPSLTETPSEDLKKKLDEYGKKIEFLEAFGMQLKPEDYFNHGTDLYYKGKYELALEAFNKTTELKPDSAEAWDNKGVALEKLGRYKEALEAYNQAIKLQPNFVIAWINKGAALINLALYDEALQVLNKAIGLKPDLAEAWNNIGFALGMLGRNDEALQAYNKAIELKPNFAEAWYNKAYSYALRGNKQIALSDLKKAIELKPEAKERAKKDKSFEFFWNDDDFKKIVG